MTIEQIITQCAIFCDAAIDIAEERVMAMNHVREILETTWFPEDCGSIFVSVFFTFENSGREIVETAQNFDITAAEIESHLNAKSV